MTHLLRIQDPSLLKGLRAADGMPVLNPATLARHAPDAHWVSLDDDGVIEGRLSLWWQATPHHAGHRLGIIGHYAAGGMEVGRQLLTRACQELRAQQCRMAVGPMDGNTWRPYRFVTESHGERPFFMEPNHPRDWPQQFIDHGFKPLANYYSSVDEDVNADTEPHAQRAADRLARLGVTLRALKMARFEEELSAIHQVVTASFQRSFLYQPLSEAQFLAEYEPIRAFLRPELVSIATCEDRPVGFIFSLPDLLQAGSGRPIDTAIIKTLAILPARRFAGLGSCLVSANRRAVHGLGYRRLIHALMHESNKSRSISARYASVFRRYSLFAKPL